MTDDEIMAVYDEALDKHGDEVLEFIALVRGIVVKFEPLARDLQLMVPVVAHAVSPFFDFVIQTHGMLSLMDAQAKRYKDAFGWGEEAGA